MKAAKGSWVLLGLLVASICINYMDRSNLSVAATNLSRELSLGPADLGLLLSAFFWSYAICQLGAGWLVGRCNAYLAYGLAFLLWSGATALTGWAGSLSTLFALRLALGMGESIAYPAYSRIIICDFPERHRGLANSAIDAGSKMGPALGTLVGGLIVAHTGWRPLFYILGFGAMVWLAPWFALMPRGGGARAATAGQEAGPGYWELAKKRDVWGTVVALFCGNYAWYFILTWLPPYLETERHFSKMAMAVYGSIPYWGIAAASIGCGWISDRLIERGGRAMRVRKTFAASGLLLTALVLPANLVKNQTAAMALLTAGCLAYGMFSSNCWAITQTLAGPLAAGKWTALQNCLGNLAGIAAPWITGAIVQKTGQFFLAFAAVAMWLAIGGCSCLFVVGDEAPIGWGMGEVARGS
jgi:MFS family permease